MLLWKMVLGFPYDVLAYMATYRTCLEPFRDESGRSCEAKNFTNSSAAKRNNHTWWEGKQCMNDKQLNDLTVQLNIKAPKAFERS